MAARENQGYLVAVILLSVLVIGLGVTTYIGMTQMAEYWDQRQQFANRYEAERRASQAYQTKSQILEAYIGVTGAESLATIPSMIEQLERTGVDEARTAIQRVQNEYRQDMQRYASGAVPDVDRTYRHTLSAMADVVAARHQQVNVLNETVASTQRERERDAQLHREELDRLQATLAQRTQELADERQRYRQQEEELRRSLAHAQQSVESLTGTVRNEQEKRTRLENQMQTELAARDQLIGQLKSRVDELTRETYDVPDGEIVQVFANQDLVLINRGSADGLRTNQSFSVFDPDVTNFEQQTAKAKIEVTRINSSDLAEARILESDHLRPIMRGDLIMSPVWDPGYSVPIALAGFFDLDGDGRSDLHRLQRMILNNGGTVAAYVDEDGRVVGQIDPTTRYLVVGDSDRPEYMAGFSQLIDQAEQMGVQQISLHRLLNWMGIAGLRRVEGAVREQPSGVDRTTPQTDPYNNR